MQTTATKLSATIVIPARIGSTRFPKKPMALLNGVSLLERTYRIAKQAKLADQIYIATDSQEILDFARSFGANAVLTPAECENGTARTHAASQQIPTQTDVWINLQGDAVLTPPWVIDAVIKTLFNNPLLECATPAMALDCEMFKQYCALKSSGRASGTLVVFDQSSQALYFSKGIVPHYRDVVPTSGPVAYRHIGLYGYRKNLLDWYVEQPSTPLEKAENLEQLRILENGKKIAVTVVDYKGRTHGSIDYLEDLKTAEKIISLEGELI